MQGGQTAITWETFSSCLTKQYAPLIPAREARAKYDQLFHVLCKAGTPSALLAEVWVGYCLCDCGIRAVGSHLPQQEMPQSQKQYPTQTSASKAEGVPALQGTAAASLLCLVYQ